MKEYRSSLYHYFAQKLLNTYKISPSECSIRCASRPGCTGVSSASSEASTPAHCFSPCAPNRVCCLSLCTSAPSFVLHDLWTTPGSCCCLCPSSGCGTILKPSKTVSYYIRLNGVLTRVSTDAPLLLISQWNNYCHVTSILLLPFMIFKSY